MSDVSLLSDPPSSRRERTDLLFAAAHEAADLPLRRRLLGEIVTVNQPVASSIATRYRGRGIADDDLQQTAYEGLVHAVRRFDPGLGHDFLSFAVPTIRGEVRRSFRDQGWVVRPPRRIQELQGRLHRAVADLSQQLQRDPTDLELTQALGIDERELHEVLGAYGSFRPASLDLPIGADSDQTLGDLLPDSARSPVAVAEARAVLGPALAALDEADRRMLGWRFWGDLTQREIGDRLGLTQVQVSRRLSRIMTRLAAQMGDGASAA